MHPPGGTHTRLYVELRARYELVREFLPLAVGNSHEETYRKWQRNIPQVDKPLERNAALCELHFDPQFVSRHFESIISGELVLLERSRPLLQPDAILTIFPNVPKYISKQVPKKRNPKERLDPHVCLLGSIMSLLHAQKLVLFRCGDSMIEHQVFVRGVELSLDEHCDPPSLLEAVDSMQLCSGAARSVEFPLARSSNMTSWYESLYLTTCKGLVSGPEKCCIASKYLRRLLLNQRCRARQLKRKENYARKLKARTQATVRRLRAKAKSLDEALTQQKQANHAIEESALKKKIEKLPPKQKAAIMQCFEAAKTINNCTIFRL
ncbi:hypothetical protein HPB49_020574 [Dermacentor silvarum]|uniref:Uncharacterized protein n=1 Tax=Dermacentor silvarum TaxID=543639 RepID=A0ACB8CML4_DERSI|nr:hypothetical protein HPB49_020574 [Dermacentor silvarum]